MRDRSGIGAILRGVHELPMLRSEPVCPAGARVAGVDFSRQGVVCRAMLRDVERDDGTELGMSAGEFGYLQRGATAGVLLELASDPSTVLNLCYGRGLPVLTDEDHQARDHYSYCPVWQAEKDRIAAGGERLAEEAQPEPTSMGVATQDAPDPWAQAQQDLDLLATGPIGAGH